MRPALYGLYLLTPDWDDSPRLLDLTEAALAGGVVLLQYRNKRAGPALRDAQASALLMLAQRYRVPMVINDDPQLAARLGAAGAHLGRDDGSLAAAREQLGARALLGASCYDDFARAQAAVAAGADIVAFGAMYPSPTKPTAVCAPRALLQRARAELAAQVACIGGITLERAPELIAAGAQLLAVITDIYADPRPEQRARAYAQLFEDIHEP